MGRELSTELDTAIDAAATGAFSYYFLVEILLPWAEGEDSRVVIRACTSPLTLPTVLGFDIFVEQVYQAVLDRPPTVAENSSNISALETAFASGPAATITAAASFINTLFASLAYAARARTDDQFIEDCYRAYLGRSSDATGKAGWLTALGSSSRAAVRAGFAGSSEFTHLVDLMNQTVEFTSHLRNIGDAQLADGSAAQDSGAMELDNLSDYYSNLLTEPARRISPARAFFRCAIQIAPGVFQLDTIFEGDALFGNIESNSAPFTLISDASRAGQDVVEQITQHCNAIAYKGYGCDSPDPSPTCSRLIDDTVNGCPSKLPAPRLTTPVPANNVPTFDGVPTLNVTTPTTAGNNPTSGLPLIENLPPNGWPEEFNPRNPRIRPIIRSYTIT
jgi:hypothetical protein